MEALKPGEHVDGYDKAMAASGTPDQSFIEDWIDIAMGRGHKNEKRLSKAAVGCLATSGALYGVGLPTAAKVFTLGSAIAFAVRGVLAVRRWIQNRKPTEPPKVAAKPKVTDEQAVEAGASVANVATNGGDLAMRKSAAKILGLNDDEFDQLVKAYEKGLLTSAKQKTQWAMIGRLADHQLETANSK